jgi:hypothetical protein
MEFGAIPQEVPARTGVGGAPARMPSHSPKRRSRWPLRTFAALLVVAVGGGSLTFVESLGPYGAYWISDRLHAGDHENLLAKSIASARKALAKDTWPDAQRGFEELAAARAGAKRFRPFAAYVAFTGYLNELRFGAAPEMRARAKVLLDEIATEDPRYADLARAARQALDGQLASAESAAGRIAASRSQDVDAALLAAEIALRGKRGTPRSRPGRRFESWSRAPVLRSGWHGPSTQRATALARKRMPSRSSPRTQITSARVCSSRAWLPPRRAKRTTRFVTSKRS